QHSSLAGYDKGPAPRARSPALVARNVWRLTAQPGYTVRSAAAPLAQAGSKSTSFGPDAFHQGAEGCGFGVLQRHFLAVEGTGGGRHLSAWVSACALTVVRTPWLLAGLLPVTDHGRQFPQVLADEGVRVVGEKARGHLIPSSQMGLEGLDHQWP